MANTLIQGNDLAYMRAETRKAMPDAVDVQRKSLVSDKQGGYTESWGNAYQQIPARLSTKVGQESNEASRQDFQFDATLTVPYDQSILQTDRVVHSSGTYEVQSVDAGKSWTTSKLCQMRRL